MLHTGSGLLTLAVPISVPRGLAGPPSDRRQRHAHRGGQVPAAARRRFGARGEPRGTARRSESCTFPLSVALLFWLTRGEHPLLFVIPVLMLTLADATCALIGRRYGLTPLHGGQQEPRGVGRVCRGGVLLRARAAAALERRRARGVTAHGSHAGPARHAARGQRLAWARQPVHTHRRLLSAARLHAPGRRSAACRGCWSQSRSWCWYWPPGIARLSRTTRSWRRRSCAMSRGQSWAGRWLVAPLAILVGYRWLSPPTPDNSRRMHGVPAVLSIWAAAVAWLALAGASGGTTMLFPYTVVFGAHLAMFGVSRDWRISFRDVRWRRSSGARSSRAGRSSWCRSSPSTGVERSEPRGWPSAPSVR